MALVLCQQLIGRDEELAHLRQALNDARSGRGGLVLILGDAGMGKSRLARESAAIADEFGLVTLWGRAAEGQDHVAHRPVSEALWSFFRTAVPPELADMEPFGSALARVMPSWGSADDASTENSTVLLGEAILKLLRSAAPTGSLLVLEDLHWADPETLSLVDYLTGPLPAEPILCLGTARADEPGPGLSLARRLAERRAAAVIELARLSATDVARMGEACLGLPALPPALGELLERAEGVPFFVEELLAGAVGSGALVRREAGWMLECPADPVVPFGFAEAVHRRLTSIGGFGPQVLHTAAVLGRSFDWQLLPGTTALDETTVLESLRRAVDAQLIVAEEVPGRFRFRHALTREAVLAQLLPPERASLARRALSELEAAHPELEGEWSHLAARLSEEAGDHARAAELLLEAGRRMLAAGALSTAEVALERARALADAKDMALAVGEALVEVLALAGRIDRAMDVAEQLLPELATVAASTMRQARLHLCLARAAVTATRWADATDHLARARALGADDVAEGGRGEALAAHVALGVGHPEEAVALGKRALELATRADAPEVACEALEVVGRAARLSDLEAAESAFERARELAEKRGLAVWRIRALHELGTIDLYRSARPERLIEARELARRAGALSTVATLDLQIAAVSALRWDTETAVAAARRAAHAGHRFGLGLVVPVAKVHEGFAHALAGRQQEAEAAAVDALRLGGDDPNVAAGAWGQCRGLVSLLAENRTRAFRELETAMGHLRSHPGAVAWPFQGVWALLRTLQGSDGDAAGEEIRRAAAARFIAAHIGYAKAVTLGQSGLREDAVAAMADADVEMGRLEGVDGFRHLAHRLVAEAAIDDGWGDPATRLRDAAEFFTVSGHQRVVLACRSLLRRTGAPLPRRGRGDAEVPAALRRLGLTSREMDVLLLVGERLSNAEIAGRLYLSPRTVEKHVEHLMAKTGARERAQLMTLAAAARR